MRSTCYYPIILLVQVDSILGDFSAFVKRSIYGPFGSRKLDSVQPNSDLASQHAHSNSTFKVVRGLDQLDLRTSLR
jgi:hypothetical protein